MKKVKRRKSAKTLHTVGWREWVALPDLHVHLVKAKIDTGARTSSLHAFDLVERRGPRGPRLHFNVAPFQRDDRTVVRCSAALHDERYVTSSSGKRELRPVIVTTVVLCGEEWPIELTLTSRDVMGFRMLLGRQALRGRCMVNPGRSFLSGRKPPARRRKG